MKQLLLIAALSACVLPTGAFADGPPAPGKHPGKTEAVSQPTEATGAHVKVFIHPETGEILSREQWESLGIESDEGGEAARSSPESPETGRAPKILKARQIDLGNGDYVIVVDTPEEEMVETRVWFDEEGKAHFSCDH